MKAKQAGLLSAILASACCVGPLLLIAIGLGSGAASPGNITVADAEAVFATGWDDRALHDAVAICALFNLMNRLVDGFWS